MRFIKLETGTTGQEIYWDDKECWETFDFASDKWLLLQETDYAIIMHCATQYPYPVSFEESMRVAVKHLSDDVLRRRHD